MLGHGQLATIGHDRVRMVTQALDEAEDIVPAPAIQAAGVVLQLVQDLVHLEGGGQGFYQHGRPDRAARNAEVVLGEVEHLVPQPRLVVALHLG